MILADKIVRLRKKNGWSQEELAQKMNVSRQAVSKWESAQTIPELEKILQLGALFGVTTDYLLKDDMELEEFTSDRQRRAPDFHRRGGNLSRTEQGIRKTDCCRDVSVRVIPDPVTFIRRGIGV